MSDRPCANEFEDLIQIEQHSPGISAAAQIVMWMVESRKSGRLAHYVIEGFSNWEQACALEDALIDTRQNDGWQFVVGRIDGDDETRGWLEYGDEIVVPYGPERKKAGSDIGVWGRDDFDKLDYTVWALADAAPESGIVLNRILKDMFRIDESLGETA